MKHILKQMSPRLFEEWKQANPDACYDDLSGDTKRSVRASLMNEQHGICCYCECCLTGDDFHIEHFRPKGLAQFRPLQLDYNNLHACCVKIPNGDTEEHCGHKKGNMWDNKLVSPLEVDCEDHFSYSLDGRIHGTDDRGTISIQILNLNSALLVASRYELLRFFQELPEDDKQHELDVHLDESNILFGEFFTMIHGLRKIL